MSELNTHYETYKATHGDKAYRMANALDTSRVKFLVNFIQKHVKPGGKILDVGCGDMSLSKILPEYEWVGVDIAPDMSEGRAVKHDLMVRPYPFESRSFDAVVCTEVLEHVWNLETVHLEARRLLKDDGTYIISTPNFDNIDHHLSGFREVMYDTTFTHLAEHIRFYNEPTHRKFLERSGFKVAETVGADAHYQKFFQEGRGVLSAVLNQQFKIPIDVGSVDQILGMMFPNWSHTIVLVSKCGAYPD